jgi:hypothetical protein
VNHDAPNSGVDHLTPDIAAYDGAVAITYFTRSSYGTRRLGPFVQETYTESEDAGVTFGTELTLGPTSDIRFAAEAFAGGPRLARFLGDYMGVVLSAGEAHAVWPLASYNGASTDPHQTTWAGTILRSGGPSASRHPPVLRKGGPANSPSLRP